MNIFGFVSAILVIFSIVVSYMLKTHIDTSELTRSMKGYYAVDTDVKNAFEDYIYDSQKEKRNTGANSGTKKQHTNNNGLQEVVIEEQNSPPQEEELIEEKERKKPKKIFACSCINIFPLMINDKAEEKQRYELLVSLVKAIYKTELEDEKNAARLVDSVISSCKKRHRDKKEIRLEQIDLRDPFLQNLWYTMLKGTKYYNCEKKYGLPSILDFIRVEEDDRYDKICLHTASLEMLRALFDEKIACQIWEKRKDEKIKITGEEMEKILNSSISTTTAKKELWSMISLSHKGHQKGEKAFICQDDQTKISLRRIPRYQ